MAKVDNSTLNEVDLDQALAGGGKEVKSTKEANSGKQTADFDINGFLLDMDAELRKPQEPEKKEPVETKEEPQEEEVQETAPETEETPEQELEKLKAENETLKKRYADSSKEVDRQKVLDTRIAELEQKLQVYNQIEGDEKLVNMIADYWKGGKQPSGNIKQELGLSEDFVFDPDDMFKDGTETNKVYMKSVDMLVDQKLEQKLAAVRAKDAKEARAQRIQTMKEEFANEFGNDALNEVEQYMKNKELTIKDIYKLMTFGERDKTIAKNAATQQAEQVRKNQDRNGSLANKKSVHPEVSNERKIIDALNIIDGGGFSFSN